MYREIFAKPNNSMCNICTQWSQILLNSISHIAEWIITADKLQFLVVIVVVGVGWLVFVLALQRNGARWTGGIVCGDTVFSVALLAVIVIAGNNVVGVGWCLVRFVDVVMAWQKCWFHSKTFSCHTTMK